MADVAMQDADAREDEKMMYGHGNMTEQELNEKYPNRPHNHSKTLPFRVLFQDLFNPLSDNKKKPPGGIARRKQGPHGPSSAPHEVRRKIIHRFISRWRQEVGNDVYPAMRLIVPEKDRERGMYGLKEMTIAKLLVKIMQIDKNSDDGQHLTHWKDPTFKSSSAVAGDFAGVCFDVISKRPMRSTPGNMSIAEVNELLDRLSVAQKEENQRPIMNEFYNRMNAEEMMWLIRMILRQMKIGATEKTIFEIWHPDAENLFNISSNLRRVCWELSDPDVKLEGDSRGISLMQCFQPQLAAFQMRSMEQMVAKMNSTEDDPIFWIEEKLDGERMQLHMIEDDEIPGGKRFGFWSRKAKDYTYLYGSGFEDNNAALTRHIREAFTDGVQNIILDGEMITWDPKEKATVSFGTLKTAALEQQNNPFATGNRPVYRVFDCLYLNGKDLTGYTLRDRRRALEASIRNVEERLEIHPFEEATKASEIDPKLHKVIAEAGEGLVLKNPRSEYRLNDRNDDWMKVKPEYMTEFGESLDCVVVGGYYGSGKRGGALSSFMCGVRPPKALEDSVANMNPQFMLSFFKVGGGFSASDYAEIRHRTEGKWNVWDRQKPPRDWVLLAGGDRQHEKPDVWIKPEDSVVLSVKAAAAGGSDQFATRFTLRFPRFKKLRSDKDWTQALTYDEFFALKDKAEAEHQDKKFKVDESKKKRTAKRQKREIVIQGQGDEVKTPYAGPVTKVFEDMTFFIMTESPKPRKKTKGELEARVKANGGQVVASEKNPDTILIADRRVIKAASIQQRNDRNILRPNYLLDCVKQGELDDGQSALLLPLEPHHLFHVSAENEGKYDDNVDEYGDSYARDITPEELAELFDKIPVEALDVPESIRLQDEINDEEAEIDSLPGWMFRGLTAYFDGAANDVTRYYEFAGGQVAESLEAPNLTHVVVSKTSNTRDIRKAVSQKRSLPRIVTSEWVTESWAEQTRLDEERFAPI